MVDAYCMEMRDVNASADFISSLTSYVWMQLQAVSSDAEFFAKHRGSEVIETADVLLCARKNETLMGIMKERMAVYEAAARQAYGR